MDAHAGRAECEPWVLDCLPAWWGFAIRLASLGFCGGCQLRSCPLLRGVAGTPVELCQLVTMSRLPLWPGAACSMVICPQGSAAGSCPVPGRRPAGRREGLYWKCAAQHRVRCALRGPLHTGPAPRCIDPRSSRFAVMSARAVRYARQRPVWLVGTHRMLPRRWASWMSSGSSAAAAFRSGGAHQRAYSAVRYAVASPSPTRSYFKRRRGRIAQGWPCGWADQASLAGAQAALEVPAGQ